METENSLLVATKLLTAKRHSCYAKGSESGVGNFGKTRVGSFGKIGVGHFNSDSATLIATTLKC